MRAWPSPPESAATVPSKTCAASTRPNCKRSKTASVARKNLADRQHLIAKARDAAERRAKAEAAASKTRPKLLEAEEGARRAEAERTAAEAVARDALALYRLRDNDFRCERARLDLEHGLHLVLMHARAGRAHRGLDAAASDGDGAA